MIVDEIQNNKKYLVKDKYADEYGVLHFEELKDILSKVSKIFHKTSKDLTPEHLFYNPNRPDKAPDISPMIKELGKLANKKTAVVSFFDENKKEYDRAWCMLEEHFDRYDIIKELKNLNEFFTFRKRKEN
jgi:hypothetical protein